MPTPQPAPQPAPEPAPEDRRPRADAERNRTRVLDAARALFAERGEEVQMPEVARAAGVGVGTVYRHFPSRRALVVAAAEHRFEEIARYARTDCPREAEPGGALARYLRHVGRVLAEDRGLSAALATTLGATAPQGQALSRLEEAVGALIARDQSAGGLRTDLTTADVYLLVCGLSAVIRTGSGSWERFVDLALEGFLPRPDTDRPTPR